jgi:hypothetical protein
VRAEITLISLARSKLVDLQQYGEPFADLIDQLGRSHASHSEVSLFPRHTTHLIDQYDARDGIAIWNGDLKGVTSRPACNWTEDAKARSHIIRARCQYDRGAAATLLVADGGIEINPDEIPSIGTVVTRLRCRQVVPIQVRNGDFLD